MPKPDHAGKGRPAPTGKGKGPTVGKAKGPKFSTLTIRAGETESEVVPFDPETHDLVVPLGQVRPRKTALDIEETADGAKVVLAQAAKQDVTVPYKVVEEESDAAEQPPAPPAGEPPPPAG